MVREEHSNISHSKSGVQGSYWLRQFEANATSCSRCFFASCSCLSCSSRASLRELSCEVSNAYTTNTHTHAPPTTHHA
jgi:hypothetical protein